MLELDLVGTLAFGGVVLLAGYVLREWIPALARYNLPEPVIGGFLVAVVVLLAHQSGHEIVRFDTTLQSPLMIAFFTTIGFGASLSLLKVGGPQVLRFFVLAAGFTVIQNLLGIGIAMAFGFDPLFGMLAGSVTMAGGPATGLAFAPLFEAAGIAGAASIAVAAAMAGIIAGGIVGGPLSTFLIDRFELHTRLTGDASIAVVDPKTQANLAELVADRRTEPDPRWLLKNLVAILCAMWVGSWVSRGFAALGLTLPAYIGAMLVAAALRNLDDATGWLGLSHRFINGFGAVSLALFLVIALMTLRLWELAGLALPLLTIIVAQVVVAALFAAFLVYRIMGRDYESAVMSGGFVGFMLGTTANAMAVMRTLVDRYGPAPAAFLVAPLVGAFFIDFTNALVITVFLNLFG
jgi:ESS family glutamate:Na+ symporter